MFKHLDSFLMPTLEGTKGSLACWMNRHHVLVNVKVREATSNDPWGPSSSLMSEIADLTFNVVAFAEVMGMVWKRLNDSGKNWRHVYKVCFSCILTKSVPYILFLLYVTLRARFISGWCSVKSVETALHCKHRL